MPVRLATQEDLDRIYGLANLLVGRPVKPETTQQQADPAEQQRPKLTQVEHTELRS
jgi:hypothetical protein